MKARQIAREALRVHKIEDGDFLVFDTGVGMKIQDLQLIGSYLNKTGRGNCILTMVDRIDGVHVFDESEMNKLGWYKAEEGDGTVLDED